MGSFASRLLQSYEDEPRYRSAKEDEEYFQVSSGRVDKNLHLKLTKINNRYASSFYLENTTSNKVEAVIKITSKAVGVKAVTRLIDYISRDISEKDKTILLSEVAEKDRDQGTSKVDIEDNFGNIYESKSERGEMIKRWSQDFVDAEYEKRQVWKLGYLAQMQVEREALLQKKVSSKLTKLEEEKLKELSDNIKNKKIIKDGKTISLHMVNPKDTTHFVLSVGGKHSGRALENATDAIREFLARNFGDAGHHYVFAAHTDTVNLHYHVVMKNLNELTRERLKLDKVDLFVLRQDLSNELTINGIERQATLRMDRVKTIEKIHKGVEQVRARHTWYQSELERGKEAFRNFNIGTYRNFTLKKTQRLIVGINKELGKLALQGSRKSLKEDLKYLKAFKKDLMKVSPDIFKIEKESLLKKINKDNILLFQKLEKLEDAPTFHIQAKGLLIQSRNERYLQEYIKKYEKEVQISLDYVKNNKALSVEEKKRSAEIIQNLQNVMNKVVGKGKDYGMSRELFKD
jgi:hypothetical protein